VWVYVRARPLYNEKRIVTTESQYLFFLSSALKRLVTRDPGEGNGCLRDPFHLLAVKTSKQQK